MQGTNWKETKVAGGDQLDLSIIQVRDIGSSDEGNGHDRKRQSLLLMEQVASDARVDVGGDKPAGLHVPSRTRTISSSSHTSVSEASSSSEPQLKCHFQGDFSNFL